MTNRPFKIDGFPVSRQEILDQATMIRGNEVLSLGLALRVLRNEGRDVTDNADQAAPTNV